MKAKRRKQSIMVSLAMIAILTVLSIVVLSLHNRTAGQNAAPTQLKLRFDYLSQQHTNLCALQSYIYSLPSLSYLQGSCCSLMNFSSYVIQVNGLSSYSNIPEIPKDPYNISVFQAEELLGYDQSIILNSTEQSIYGEAVNMSTEHGPCCCRCWRWYAFEGQAKYFIRNKMFNARQIANLWDLEDGCGGPFDSGGYQPNA